MWKPVETPVANRPTKSRTGVKQVGNLPLKQAYEARHRRRQAAGADPARVRSAKGTDHALLSHTLDNERAVLLAHWFRCVKAAAERADRVPFYSPLRREKRASAFRHLFFVIDGANKQELPDDQPADKVVEGVMSTFLERCYAETRRRRQESCARC